MQGDGCQRDERRAEYDEMIQAWWDRRYVLSRIVTVLNTCKCSSNLRTWSLSLWAISDRGKLKRHSVAQHIITCSWSNLLNSIIWWYNFLTRESQVSLKYPQSNKLTDKGKNNLKLKTKRKIAHDPLNLLVMVQSASYLQYSAFRLFMEGLSHNDLQV